MYLQIHPQNRRALLAQMTQFGADSLIFRQIPDKGGRKIRQTRENRFMK